MFILVLCFSCPKFESPYEDLNGIYLQWVGSYDATGVKIAFDDEVGYILHGSLASYIIHKESIEPAKYYSSNRGILDFDVKDSYAYLACPSFGLELVDFQIREPYLCGELEIPGAKTVKVNDSYAYLLDNKSLYVVDISNKQEPQIIGEFNFSVSPNCLEVDSNSAYVLLSNNTFCILDIANPHTIESKLELHEDSVLNIDMFVINGPYIYFLGNNNKIVTYENKGGNLVLVSEISLPPEVTFLSAEKDYAIALADHTLYLISLEYPSQPCASEMINLPSHLRFGIKKENYIFLLTPDLNVVEVKEIPK